MQYRGYMRSGGAPSIGFVVAMLATAAANAANYSPAASTPMSKVDGLCSLFEAGQAISSGKAVDSCPAGTSSNVITLGKGTYTLTTGISLNKATVIQGAGSGSGGSLIRGDLQWPFGSAVVADGPATGPNLPVDLKDLALEQTNETQITGIYSYRASVTLNNVRVTGFNRGGIVVDYGYLNVFDSEIANNSTSSDGGGIAVNANPDNTSEFGAGLHMERSSVIGNHADGNGGGIYYRANSNSNLYNVTIGENSATNGGGIYADMVGGGYLDSYHLTVANNSASGTGGGIRDVTSGGTPIRLNFSIVNDNDASSTCFDVDGGLSVLRSAISNFDDSCYNFAQNSWIGINAALGPLMDMGGNRTRVYPLTKNSPFKDSLTTADSSETEDGRGFSRPFDGNNDGVVKVDLGAFELNPRWETEFLPVAGSSGDAHSVQSSASYSQGKGTRLSANAVNDYVKYQVPIAEDGNYKVAIGVRSATNAATFRLSSATSVNGTYTNIGGTVNLNAAANYYEVDLTPNAAVHALTTGQRYFQAKVTTCPSGGCSIYLDYIKLVRQ